MSRNVFFLFFFASFNSHGVSLEAAAKVKLVFLTGKKNLKFFFEKFYPSFLLVFLSICQGTLLVLRGANVVRTFESHKLF